ncbi:hypothetical protein WJX74_008181 [Apatococcus lobatus]|uniref:RING-type domain-containing protein n=1 Tax=Apatococcus lobatus TaxID=904363 RepID=A0AAW1QU71_9CHLO
MLPSGHVPDAQGLGYPAGQSVTIRPFYKPTTHCKRILPPCARSLTPSNGLSSLKLQPAGAAHQSTKKMAGEGRGSRKRCAAGLLIQQVVTDDSDGMTPSTSETSGSLWTGDCRQKRRLSAAGHEPSAARQDAKKFITKRPRLPAAAPKKISNLFEHLQHDDPKLVSISADSTSSPSPSSASSSELPLLQRPETRRMSRGETVHNVLTSAPHPMAPQQIAAAGRRFFSAVTNAGAHQDAAEKQRSSCLKEIKRQKTSQIALALLMTAEIRSARARWPPAACSSKKMTVSRAATAPSPAGRLRLKQVAQNIICGQLTDLTGLASMFTISLQTITQVLTAAFSGQPMIHASLLLSSSTQELLGTDARQAPVDAQGLPDRMEGAAEEYQQRSFLKLLLESVLESRSPVLNYTALLETYASLSGQAHKREIQNLRRLMSCLEGSGIIKRTDLSQQKGRDAVARSARWTLTSIKPIVAVIDTFAAAVKPPPADNPALPPDEPLFLSRSDLRPFAQEVRGRAGIVADQLRRDMQQRSTLTAAQRSELEKANMDRVATSFISFKNDIIAAGAASHGLHPVYHVKLEASVLQLHQLAQRAIATPDLPDGAIGGDGKKAPREKGCSRHRSIPCAHSIGLHHHLQDPKLWDIEDPVAESFGRHSIQMCDTCAHFLKNNGHPPLVPVDGFGTSCPLGRKFKLPESASQIQELVDVLVMPGTPASNREQLCQQLVQKLKIQMAEGSVMSALISDIPGIQTDVICNSWCKLAANLGMSKSVPTGIQIGTFRHLFASMTADLLSTFAGIEAPPGLSLKQVWDFRTEGGITVYSRYEDEWEHQVLATLGFRGQEARRRPLINILMRFRHAVVSICQSGGQTEPAAIDAASETGSAPQDEVEETKEHHRMEAVQDLHAEGWDIGELTQPFEKVREGLATHTEQPRDVEESPKQIEKQMSLCDAVIILLQAAIAEMPEDRLLGCALDTISCLTDYVSQKKTSTAHACSVLKAKLHALRQLADIIPTLSDPICATCTLRPVNKMLSPCGHTLCTPCATRMRDTSPSCWFCRRPVHGENDIFFS